MSIPLALLYNLKVNLNHTEHMVENPEIVIHNSSFGSLDLNPGTKAQITDCYIDAQFKPRPTLITANNSDVSIQNCHFRNFINENGSTVLYGHYYSHTHHREFSLSSNTTVQKGFYSCKITVTCSSIIQHIPIMLPLLTGYSAISLRDGIQAVVINTMFSNNSALVGGAVIARFQCKVTLTNSTFSSNKAIAGKTLNISKISNLHVRRAAHMLLIKIPQPHMPPVSSALFNQTSLGDKKHKFIAAHLLVRNKFHFEEIFCPARRCFARSRPWSRRSHLCSNTVSASSDKM